MEKCRHEKTMFNGDLGIDVCTECNEPLRRISCEEYARLLIDSPNKKKKKKSSFKKILKYLDIVKLKKDSDILIRQTPDRTEVHLADGEMYCEQVGFFEPHLDEKELDKYINLLYIIKNELLEGRDKFDLYKVYIGKVPNDKSSDESYNEMFKHISEDTYEKLYDAGYEVVKRVD